MAVIQREWNSIDLLIEIKTLRLVILIENKIGARAGEGQLARYRQIVERHFPTYRYLFVFLTPHGHEPDEDGYIAVSYSDVANVLESLIPESHSDTALILTHYIEMLRRHVVPDRQLEALARQLYERHKDAFEFVFRIRPETGDLLGVVGKLLDANPNLVQDRLTATAITFAPEAWKGVSVLNSCGLTEWTKTGRSLIFEVRTYSSEAYANRVKLALVVGPAPLLIREQIYKGACIRPKIFKGLVKSMGGEFATIYSRDLLSVAAARTMSAEDKVTAIEEAWVAFIADDLQCLTQAILEIFDEGA